jgi:transposase
MLLQHIFAQVGMARKTGRAALVLSEEHRATLSALAGSRTAALREVQRAKVLLAYAQGKGPTEIGRALGVSRPTIYKCIDKALATGVMTGLRDRYHRARAPQITEAAKAWVVSLACRKPKDLGLAAELWTISALAQYVAAQATGAGFARLSQAGKATVWRILDAHDLKPHRVRYYLERRDAQFERKMAEVLMVYRDVNLYRTEAVHDGRAQPIYTVSVDEKPGVQALSTTGADLPPVPGKHAGIGRDHEYVRHGTLSIIAALDLHTGEIIVSVPRTHLPAPV